MLKFLKYLFICSICLMLFPINVSAKEQKIDYDTFMEYAEEIGDIYDINPYLLCAICERESSMRINVVNK